MRKFHWMFCVVFFLLSKPLIGADSDIRLNSLGFLPNMPKQATVAASGTEFAICRVSDDKTVLTGTLSGPRHQSDVNQDVWTADFSAIKEPGRYYLNIPGVGRSYEFEIGNTVYDKPFYAAMRGFYLWRCGTAVQCDYNGVHFAHAACHLNDAWQDYVGIKDIKRDGTGGWHDAGDFGKYTVNAGVTVGVLFLAWDHFGPQLTQFKLDIPDTAAGYPDFLKEIKWEIDWLLKMQYPDGSGRVSHKLTTLDFPGFIMPEKDDNKTYFTDWGTAATADFVAMTAMAARYFKPYDTAYAQKCLDAAKVSYRFLTANPRNKNPELSAFKTGGYGTSDSDDRLWAAAELWETTGDPNCLRDFEQQVSRYDNKIETNWDWGNVRNLGCLTYLLSKRPGKTQQLAEDVRNDLVAAADSIVRQAKADIYARPFGGSYFWGCNGSVARQAVILQTANQIAPNPDYRSTVLDAVGHLFGRNYYGRSFVTGLGWKPPMNPHDRRCGADGVNEPWPGYLVGGGQKATDWKDDQEDYRTNEIAINWQAALIYALAGFVSGQ